MIQIYCNRCVKKQGTAGSDVPPVKALKREEIGGNVTITKIRTVYDKNLKENVEIREAALVHLCKPCVHEVINYLDLRDAPAEKDGDFEEVVEEGEAE